MMFVVSYWTLP